MAPKMTDRRLAVLQRLALVPDDMIFKCGGQTRIICGGLVKLGYAERIADNLDDGFASAYAITYAGRCYLESCSLPSKRT